MEELKANVLSMYKRIQTGRVDSAALECFQAAEMTFRGHSKIRMQR